VLRNLLGPRPALAPMPATLRREADDAPAPVQAHAGVGADILTAALEASHVAVTISDVTVSENPLIYVNAAFETITGFSREDVLGRNCRFLQGAGTDPETVEELRRAIRQQRTCDVELLNYRRDGSAFWNSLHIAPLKNARGKTTAFIGMQRDVTAERQERDRERRHDRMLALGRLSGGVAHKIDELLHPVGPLSERIAAALPEASSHARADLSLIAGNARDASTVVRRLLDFGGGPECAGEAVSFDEALNEALQTAPATLPPTVTLETRVATEGARTFLQPTEVEQILRNLVANAVEAMDGDGGLTIEARKAPERIVLSVADTGPGIPHALRERVFEAFYSTKPPGRSMGLGLFMVHEIVARVGGRARVTDTSGGGATIVIDLPLVADDALADAAIARHQAAP